MSFSLSRIRRSPTVAHVAPFVTFLLLLPLTDLVKQDRPDAPWWLTAPEHWIYPLQTVVCLGLLAFFWRNYEFRPCRGQGFAVSMALVGIAVWILPSLLFDWLDIETSDYRETWALVGVSARDTGFDPTIFADRPFWFGVVVVGRLVRMVIVVALIEEVFWRGFLMRYLIDLDRPFHETPFGTPGRVSVLLTVALFTAEHNPVDWVGAVVFGSLACWVAIRTRSLFACVLMHAVANLVLGIFVVTTGRWGFW